MKKHIQNIGIVGLFAIISYLYVWSFVRTGIIYVSSDRISVQEVQRRERDSNPRTRRSGFTVRRV